MALFDHLLGGNDAKVWEQEDRITELTGIKARITELSEF
jgi:hypothetical protein